MCTLPDPIERGLSRFQRTAAAVVIAAPLALNLGIASAEAPHDAGVEAPHVKSKRIGPSQDPAHSRLESLSERDIKRLYRACSDESITRRLGSGEITHCSMIYEVLLKQHFAGDFNALLTWSSAPQDLLRQ